MNTLKALWKVVKEHAKTVAAFIAGIVVNVLISLFKGETPWPQNSAEWWQLALSSFGPAITVWAARNKITQKQIDKDPNVIGGVVVSSPPAITPAAVVPPAVGGLYS